MQNTQLQNGKKIYFVSDSHLGIPDYESSLKREKMLVAWLDMIKIDAEEIFLLGDIFDFWFEYKTVVPKGYIRLLGKLSELSDTGIKVHFFTGNHDMWLFDYFVKELNAIIHRVPIVRIINNKKFFIGHGDGLGPADHGYKFIKRIFSHTFSHWLFARLHPDFGARVAGYFSYKSRMANIEKKIDETFHGDRERLVRFAKEKLTHEHFDYFVFGHRHIPVDYVLSEKSRFINTGDWIKRFSYACFDGEKTELLYYLK